MHTHYHKTLCRLSKSQTWPRRGRKDMPKASDLGQTDVRTDRRTDGDRLITLGRPQEGSNHNWGN